MKGTGIGWMVTLLLLGQNLSLVTQGVDSAQNWEADISQEKNVQTEEATKDSSQIVESFDQTKSKSSMNEIKKSEESASVIDKPEESKKQFLLAGDTETDPIIVDSALTATVAGKYYVVVNGGSIKTVVSGSSIVEMRGGTVTTLLGKIDSFTGGVVQTMNSGSEIEQLNGGTVSRANGNSTIKNFISGNVLTTQPNSKIETMSGGTIRTCNGDVSHFTGNAKITNLYGTIETMAGGSIRTLSGFVKNMSRGSINYTMFFSNVSVMSGGMIEAHDRGATVTTMNGGVIKRSFGSISTMADGLIVYYEGSIPSEGSRGNGTVIDGTSLETLIKNVSSHDYDGTAPYDFQKQNNWGSYVSFTYNEQEAPPTEVGAYLVEAKIDYQGELVATITGESFSIMPRELSFTNVEVEDKVYDGKTTAKISKVELTNVLPSDNGEVEVDLDQSKAILDQKDAGTTVTGKVEAKDLVLVGGKARNYKLADAQSITIKIEVKPFLVDGKWIDFSGQLKPYDGKKQANLIAVFKDGVVQVNDSGVADDLSLEITNANYFDAKIGSKKSITYTWQIIGKDADNYTLGTPPEVTGDITSPLVTNEIKEKIIQLVSEKKLKKVYDGNVADQFTMDISELFSTTTVEKFELEARGEYAEKNSGERNFTITDWAIKDGKAEIGLLPTSPIVLIGEITPKAINIDWNAEDKEYDGEKTAVVHGTSEDIVPNDEVNFTGAGSFVDKHVESRKTVKIHRVSASGVDASNYNYSSTGTATAMITPKKIDAQWRSEEKIYDGKKEATVSAELLGVIKGDELSVMGIGTFLDARAEKNKLVSIEVISEGKDRKNYAIASEASTTGTINPRTLTIIGVKVVDRVVNDSLFVELDGSQAQLLGVLSKDRDKVSFTLNAGKIQTIDVGKNKPIQTAIELHGPASENYRLTQPELTANILSAQTTNTINKVSKSQQQMKKSQKDEILKANDTQNLSTVLFGVVIVILVGGMVLLRRNHDCSR